MEKYPTSRPAVPKLAHSRPQAGSLSSWPCQELGTGRPVARAIAHIQKALERSEDDLAVRRSREGEVRLFNEIEDIAVPGGHLDKAPASGKRLGEGGHLRHYACPKRRGRRTRL